MNVICGSEAEGGGECNNLGWRWNTAMSGEMAEIIHTNQLSKGGDTLKNCPAQV